MFRLENVVRKNILELLPYSSARNEFDGKASIWLDANENPFNTKLNRYPDPNQWALKSQISVLKKIDPENIFIGNGSDEAIDLLFRVFCEPNQDKVYLFPPTYGMYVVSAKINNIETVEIPLIKSFALPPIEIIKNSIQSGGLLFICSPNNPTGNVFLLDRIKEIADNFKGIVVIDEAYIDFAKSESGISLLASTPNLIVLQTMSKAYGLAGLRIGMALGSPEIIAMLNRVKPPYNVNSYSQIKALEAFNNISKVENQINLIIQERTKLASALETVDSIKRIYPSASNFILAEFEKPLEVYNKLKELGIVIRNQTKKVNNALRITVGTADENNALLKALKNI